jgi:hypothetical protein
MLGYNHIAQVQHTFRLDTVYEFRGTQQQVIVRYETLAAIHATAAGGTVGQYGPMQLICQSRYRIAFVWIINPTNNKKALISGRQHFGQAGYLFKSKGCPGSFPASVRGMNRIP